MNITQLSDQGNSLYQEEWRPALISQVLAYWDHNARQGSKAQKNRSAVRGGGRKPWAQKKTGRARAGTIRSPLWRGGGVTFASDGTLRKVKILKKQYRVGIRSIFARMVKENLVYTSDQLSFGSDQPKTKQAAEALTANKLSNTVVFVTDNVEANFLLSVRNIVGVSVIRTGELNPRTLLGANYLVLDKDALTKVEAWLS